MSETARRPNIVYILADDMGYGDVGRLNPGSKIPTPEMDGVARSGIVFTDAHSNSAVCTPTRYGVLTGRYCWRGALKKGVVGGYSEPIVEPGRMTVASLLKAAGYATACVGKWHLGLGWQRTDRTPKSGAKDDPGDGVDFTAQVTAGPHTVGFDYSFIIPASLDMAPYVYLENGRVTAPVTQRIDGSPRPAFWREGYIADGFAHETCLHELTKKAVAYIDERGKDESLQPFFLYFPLPSPHTPHVPREPFRGKSRAGEYGDFVVETDWTVGQVVEALERAGLAENTLLVVTSDNGCHSEPIGLEEKYGHLGNYIYRGQKSDAWDGGHRIPFIARWPGRIKAGTKCDATICLTDLMATVAAVTGRELPRDAGEDSVSILPLLDGTAAGPVREATVHHSIWGAFAIRRGRWKLVCCRGSGGWTLKEQDAGPEPMQLYDMEADPREQKNLYNDHPEVVRELEALLERYRSSDRSVP